MMPSQRESTIAVVGATGRQGGQVVRHLLDDGWRVRALTRNPNSKKAARLRDGGAEVVRADLDDADSLDAAFAQAYGVFNMQAPQPGAVDVDIRRGMSAARAADRAGVRHLVYGSAGPGEEKTGIEQWDAKIEVARGMREMGLPLTVLRPMAFMELMVDPTFYPQSSTWYTMPRLAGVDCRIPWLSVRDLGAIAALAFADRDRFIGKDLPLAADVKSLAECRALYREVKGKNPPRFPMPLFVFRRFVGEDVLDMWRWLRLNPVSVDTSLTYAIHGGAMDVRTWLQRPQPSAAR